MNVDYSQLLLDIRNHLVATKCTSTPDITKAIEQFFEKQYQNNYTVLPSSRDGGEFLVDILVAAFNPRNLVNCDEKGSISLQETEPQVLLAVESELGGSGGSSPCGIMKNVVEDFMKLLLVTSHYKVLFFTSLPYVQEQNQVENRVKILHSLFCKAQPVTNGLLLVHLNGTRPEAGAGQVKVTIENNNDVRGFYISETGGQCFEIAI